MNLNDSLNRKKIPLRANGGLLSNLFSLCTRVLPQAVKFPVVPFPLSPTTDKTKAKN